MVCHLFASCWVTLRFLFSINTRILDIEHMWVTTGNLAESMKPGGQLSASVADIGINVLRDSCEPNKVIFPFIVTAYLLQRKFNTIALKNHFRKDPSYKLSHRPGMWLFECFF